MLRNSECFKEFAGCCDMLIKNVLKTFYLHNSKWFTVSIVSLILSHKNICHSDDQKVPAFGKSTG